MLVSPAPGGLSHWPQRQRHTWRSIVCTRLPGNHWWGRRVDSGKESDVRGWWSSRWKMWMPYPHQPLGVALNLLFISRNDFHSRAAPVQGRGWASVVRRRFLRGKSSAKGQPMVFISIFSFNFIFATLAALKDHVDLPSSTSPNVIFRRGFSP